MGKFGRVLAAAAIAAVLMVPVPATAHTYTPGETHLQPMAANTAVYVAKTGKKYHKSSCRYVKRSKRKLTLKEAKRRGYTACRVCKPPTR